MQPFYRWQLEFFQDSVKIPNPVPGMELKLKGRHSYVVAKNVIWLRKFKLRVAFWNDSNTRDHIMKYSKLLGAEPNINQFSFSRFVFARRDCVLYGRQRNVDDSHLWGGSSCQLPGIDQSLFLPLYELPIHPVTTSFHELIFPRCGFSKSVPFCCVIYFKKLWYDQSHSSFSLQRLATWYF